MDIIGNGLIANAFKLSRANIPVNIVVFASGVSNSKESNPMNFKRELDLISNVSKEKKIIYFSTCSIFDSFNLHSPYVQHKLNVEDYIRNHFESYLIIRLPQLIGIGGNPPTLVNFFFDCILNNRPIKIEKKSKRNLIDIYDVVRFTFMLINNNNNFTINMANPNSITVLSILSIIEKIINKKAIYHLVDSGSFYDIDISDIRSIIDGYDLYFPDNYVNLCLKKYYEN